MKFPEELHLRASGMPRTIRTAAAAIAFIDNGIPAELARLPRWTFARALLIEAIRNGKSRDMNAAVRQLRQALSNEGWLDQQA